MSIDQRAPGPRTPARTEQRIIASKPRAAGRSASAGGIEETEGEAPPRGRRKLLGVLLAVVLLVGAGAGYWFLLGPGAGGAADDAVAAEEPAPEPGEVLTVDAVSLNLAGGHYLRLGIALQLTTDVAETPEPAVALDHAIALFSGRTVEEVSSAEGRESLKAELSAQLVEAYEGEVMGVYFTDYVTQ